MKKVAKVYKKVFSISADVVCFSILLDCLKYIIKGNKIITFLDKIFHSFGDICVSIIVIASIIITIIDIVDSVKKQKFIGALDYIFVSVAISGFLAMFSFSNNGKINYVNVIGYSVLVIVLLGIGNFLLKYGLKHGYNLGFKDIIKNFMEDIKEEPKFDGPKEYDNKIGRNVKVNFRK